MSTLQPKLDAGGAGWLQSFHLASGVVSSLPWCVGLWVLGIGRVGPFRSKVYVSWARRVEPLCSIRIQVFSLFCLFSGCFLEQKIKDTTCQS